MKLPEFAINRSVTLTMILIAAVIFGVICIGKIEINIMPDLDYPVVAVIATYPGVAPEEIETMVTEHLEGAAATVDGVRKVKAVSLEGISMIMVEFEWGADLDVGAQDVRNMVELVLDELPDEVERPLVMKFDMDMLPVVYYGVLTRTGRDLTNLRTLLKHMVKKRLEALPGVASVKLQGGYKREIIIEVDRNRLKAHNLSLGEIIERVRSQNIDIPGGHVTRGANELTIRTLGKYSNINQIENTILKTENGFPIYIKDVAQVIDSHKEIRSYGRANLHDSVLIMVSKEPGANTLKVVNAVNKELDRIERTLPPDIEIVRSYDTSVLIKATVAQLLSSGGWGFLFAVTVIFLFLWNFRTTLTLGLTIPFCFIVTILPLYATGNTLNQMTLSGLALGIGLIVDNSVVVMESIFRHLEEGKEKREAARIGASEVGTAITASTLTTIIVFLPMVFAAGVSGILVRGLGMAVTFSLLASLLTALTFVPMMGSKIFKLGSKKKGRKVFDRLKGMHRGILGWTLKHRGSTASLALLIFGLGFFLIRLVGTEFMPKLDEENYTAVIKLPPGFSLEETSAFMVKVEEAMMSQPEFASEVSFIGLPEETSIDAVFGVAPSAIYEAENYIRIVPKKERKRSAQEVLADISSKIPELEGATIYFMDDMDWYVGGGERAIEVKVFGRDIKELKRLGEIVESELEKIEGVCYLDNSLRAGKPELQVVVDRDKASQMGISVENIAGTVDTAFLGRKAGKYREAGEEHDIRVRFAKCDRKTAKSLKDLIVASPLGFQVNLTDVAQVKEGIGPAKINREDQERVVVVSASAFGRDLGSIMKEVKEEIDKMPLPEGYYLKYGGSYEDMLEMQKAMLGALILVILLVYMVMASQFESFLYPLVIMFSVPLALIGVALALLFTRTTLSVMSFMGLLMLVGTVVNYAIVMIDYINQLRKKGMKRDEAVVEGAVIRLRPILISSITTVLALAPMALSRGEGSELFSPIAITMLGGLFAGASLSLIIIPTFYSLFDDLAKKMKRKKTYQAVSATDNHFH